MTLAEAIPDSRDIERAAAAVTAQQLSRKFGKTTVGLMASLQNAVDKRNRGADQQDVRFRLNGVPLNARIFEVGTFQYSTHYPLYDYDPDRKITDYQEYRLKGGVPNTPISPENRVRRVEIAIAALPRGLKVVGFGCQFDIFAPNNAIIKTRIEAYNGKLLSLSQQVKPGTFFEREGDLPQVFYFGVFLAHNQRGDIRDAVFKVGSPYGSGKLVPNSGFMRNLTDDDYREAVARALRFKPAFTKTI